MRISLTISFLISFTILSSAQTGRADTMKYCLINDQIGIGGYDPVSYFTTKNPLKGSKSNSSVFDGATYFFASDQNRKLFVKDPAKYLPQFGGWCSMTLAMGRATQPTFDNFLIDSGKLYLFERTLSLNGKEIWLKDVKTNQQLASNNYFSLLRNRKIK